VLTEDARELARDAGIAEADADRHEGRSTFVARLDPRSGSRVRQEIELAVDTARLHFFDRDSGEGIYDA
jgi:multiple sugar transport system ATP-binding protein